jgi:hypothetical protein
MTKIIEDVIRSKTYYTVYKDGVVVVRTQNKTLALKYSNTKCPAQKISP